MAGAPYLCIKSSDVDIHRIAFYMYLNWWTPKALTILGQICTCTCTHIHVYCLLQLTRVLLLQIERLCRLDREHDCMWSNDFSWHISHLVCVTNIILSMIYCNNSLVSKQSYITCSLDVKSESHTAHSCRTHICQLCWRWQGVGVLHMYMYIHVSLMFSHESVSRNS